jgi:heat shock protein HslJ
MEDPDSYFCSMKQLTIALSILILIGAGCSAQKPNGVGQKIEAPYDDSGTDSRTGGSILSGERFIIGSWELKSFRPAGKGPQDVTKEGATLDINADGRISGQICNVLNGSYTLNANTLKATDVISTQRFCAGISSEMEMVLLEGLNAGMVAESEGNTFTLRTSTGAEFSYSRKPSIDTPINAEGSSSGTRPADGGRGIAVGEPYPTNTNDSSVNGTIISIDLTKIPVDGPTMIKIRTAKGAAEIHLPSFGMNLCAASKNIADPYKLKVGDVVEANGAVSEEGIIVPCQSEAHYLRVTKK